MRFDKSKISIVIACKNEGEGILKILKSVKQYSSDIIVVDGYSNDGTEEKVKRFGARFYLDNKKGRGDALKIGIKQSKKPIVVFFDADGSHEASDIPSLIQPILNNSADLVIGSRRTGGSFDINSSFAGIIRSAGCDFLVVLVNKRFNTSLTDILYSFRAIKKSTALRLKLETDDFRIEQEMVVASLKRGFKVAEVPSREKARAWGKSKLKTITGIRFVWDLINRLYLS